MHKRNVIIMRNRIGRNKYKTVVMSRKEVALIILTVVGALALFTWQTYRMAQHHMDAPSPKQNVSVASDTAQLK